MLSSIMVQLPASDVTITLQLPNKATTVLCPHVPHLSLCLAQVGIKWILNTMTTGAHVLKGKVVGNLMIDVQVRLVAPLVCLFG